MVLSENKHVVDDHGYAVVPDIYSNLEINKIVDLIDLADSSRETFRKSKNIFAIRQFVKEIPGVWDLLWTSKLRDLVSDLFGEGFFLVKSIYFDKPGDSNWFVSYHQDLTISVSKKENVEGYVFWTRKKGQFAVQPPNYILEQNFKLRIHLDETDETNGALRVLPGSHKNGIHRVEDIGLSILKEVICKVPKGGVMIMRPLLMHASSRSTSNRRRRVIHLEFSDQDLPIPLKWSEML